MIFAYTFMCMYLRPCTYAHSHAHPLLVQVVIPSYTDSLALYSKPYVQTNTWKKEDMDSHRQIIKSISVH